MQLLQLLVACQDKADAGAVHKSDLFKIKLYRFGLIFFYQVDADLLEIANGKIIQIPVKIKVRTKLAVYRKPFSRIISAISQNRYAKAPMSLSYIDKRNVLEK